MLLIDAIDSDDLRYKASAFPCSEAWVWVDTSASSRWLSVMKAPGVQQIAFPWQRFARREFVPEFDD
jgi:hypothetical protein